MVSLEKGTLTEMWGFFVLRIHGTLLVQDVEYDLASIGITSQEDV